MRSIETISDILTFPVRMLYPSVSAGVFTCFERFEDEDYLPGADERADEDRDPASNKKDLE